MSQLGIYLISLFLSLFSSVPKNIEKAFLQNNAALLHSLLPVKSAIHISLPEPISFSDQVSDEQAYFLFRRIFRTYTTFEFYPENQKTASLEKSHYIFKARWSFLTKNRNQHVFKLFFYVRFEPGLSENGDPWKIAEIKAEKI